MNSPNPSPSSTPTTSPSSPYPSAAQPSPAYPSAAPPPLPPPLPAQPIGYATPLPHMPAKANFAQQAAKASWMAPIIAIFLGFLANNSNHSHDRSGALVVAFANMGLVTIGFALGIVALLGIRRHGRQGVLGPA